MGSTLISAESIAKADGVWSRMPGFLGSFCEDRCAWGLWGTRRDLRRRVLNVLRVEVCDGRPGSGEPGRTECLGCAVHGFPVRFC